MTDLERLELVLRRVADHIQIQPHETSPQALLTEIIEGLTKENTDLAMRALVKGASP